MVRLATLLLAGAVCVSSPGVRAADPPPIERVRAIEGVTEFRLPNGLRVLLYPDQSRPQFTVHVTVLVGSRHEGYGEAGMAHLLEHMNIKSTPSHPDIQKALINRGARKNASTWVDRTDYFGTMPAAGDNLEFAIRLEADRLVNSDIKREALLTEMTVVRNEFEMRENDPENVLVERMTAAAFRWHNYGKATIGNRSDIERVPVDSLRAFYKKHYRVDNSVLTITGQFDEARALELVARYFGPLKKPAEKLAPTYTQEPPQDGERFVTLARAGTTPPVGVVYHVPAASHPDFPAVRFLESCLTSSPDGRVHKALVEGKKAAAVGGQTRAYHDPGLMEFVATVDGPAGIDAARDTLVGTIESLATEPITEDEVERTKRRYRLGFERLTADAEEMAHALGEWSARGDWRLLFLQRDAVEALTAADANRVAAKYLTRNNRTVGVYHPTEKPERVAIPEAPDLAKRLEGYAGRGSTVAAGEAFDATPENLEKRITRGTLGPIKTAFLPKKIRTSEAHVRLVLRYGNEESLRGQSVAGEFLPIMLRVGTRQKTAQQLADAVSKLGADIAVSGDVGLLVVSVTAKKDKLAAALKLVAEVLREPAWPADQFDQLKAQALAGLAASKGDPDTQARTAVARKLKDYPKDDVRYAATTDELIEMVKATTLDRVKALYDKQVGAAAGELAAVGEFDAAVVTGEIDQALTGWTSKVTYRRLAERTPAAGRGERIVIDTPDKENAVYKAALAVPISDADPDYVALRVGARILGGDPFTSRLGNRVRREKGLSYHVEAVFGASALDPSASLELYAITNPANMGAVESTVAEELKKFLADGVTAEEL